jgi:ABC-type dipeptide/oligopeptide/nickel transport system permease component
MKNEERKMKKGKMFFFFLFYLFSFLSKSFAVRRIGAAFVTLFLVSVFCFLAFAVIPGDPASWVLGINATDEQVAALRE